MPRTTPHDGHGPRCSASWVVRPGELTQRRVIDHGIVNSTGCPLR